MLRTYLNKNIPITIIVENSCVKNLEFGDLAGTIDILRDELFIWKFLLWILVQEFHIRMRRCGVEIVVEFFYVFAMVSLLSRDAIKTLLENGVYTVPERHRETNALVIVGESSKTIFSPSISAGAGVLMREVSPSITISRVVFANSCLSSKAIRKEIV